MPEQAKGWEEAGWQPAVAAGMLKTALRYGVGLGARAFQPQGHGFASLFQPLLWDYCEVHSKAHRVHRQQVLGKVSCCASFLSFVLLNPQTEMVMKTVMDIEWDPDQSLGLSGQVQGFGPLRLCWSISAAVSSGAGELGGN